MMLLSTLLTTLALAGPLQDFNTDWDEPDDIDWGLGPGFQGIVNGTETNDHPAVVALGVDFGYGMFIICSGTLIHEEWVVTAAHCVDPSAQQQFSYGTPVVIFGKNATTGGQFTVEIDKFKPHPSWTGGADLENDIGLVKMVEPVTDVEVMIVNDEPPDDSWVGTKLTFVGYGVTSDAQQGSGIKRKTKIPIVDVSEQTLISFDANTNVCNGDSGGAALEKTEEGLFELVGVNSFVTPSCNGGANGATNVASFLDFLERNVPEVLYEVPVEELPAGAGLGVGGPLSGVGPRWSDRTGPGGSGGCDTGSGAPMALWWTALALLGLRRRS